MKKTDYSKIAHKYDKNKIRTYIKRDTILEDYIKNTSRKEYNVLDLACGTGNYLAVQVQAFKGYKINWYGLDASEEMLQIAKEKVEKVEYLYGFAENLPYESEKFDFIACNYSFHHFENKPKALDEITRTLKRKGMLHMKNLSPQHMTKWFIYQYFPLTYNEDQKRFWKDEQIFQELEKRCFEVRININYYLQRVELSEFLKEAENRNISQLMIMSDEYYTEGINKIKQDLENDHNLQIINEVSLFSCIAKKVK